MTKVSVPIITYNQAKFIGKAIESVLEQKTNFDFEILIGDDFSNDGTREIILDYASRYPNKIIPVLHPKNLGRNGLFNALETYKLAKGDYIASLDGDDYWTNPLKLQKQFDFMEANPDFSICFHNTLITYEDSTPSELVNDENQKAVSTIDDLIGEDEIWFMGTSSVMFRNYIETYPKWFMESFSGDIPRYVLLAKKGKIGYLPEVMSVYRKNQGGVSYTDNYNNAVFLQNRIDMYRGINGELNYSYNKVLRKNIARYYRMMLDSVQYKDNYFKRLPIVYSYLTHNQHPWSESKEIIKTYVVPASLMKLYSAIALLPHRLKKSNGH